ncbi:MAG: DEAD/DEAH box helicase, partial [Planctomycetota bacterium]
RRGTQRIGLGDAEFTSAGSPGIAMVQGQIAPLHVAGGRSGGMLSWAGDVASRNPTLVDQAEVAALLDALAAKQIPLPMMWPDGWGPKRLAGVRPRPRLQLTTPLADKYRGPTDFLGAKVGFEYEGARVESGASGFVAVSFPDGTAAVVERHAQAEREATDRFLALGGKHDTHLAEYRVHIKRVPTVAAGLLADGWEVVRDAAKYRSPGAVNIRVTSGIDWFDLEGAAQFGETSASIGAVLEALRKGERFVSLGDGSLGLLPDEWLSKHGRWLGLGRAEGESVRFSKAQLSLVDALMAELPEATCDKQVAIARQKLRKFDGIEARKEPRTFKGELRPYQRQGLGWLTFLAEFGLGGCLADDMGLGKTVQLLAHLADRRKQGERQPWLVVAPKSLVLNWAKEAQRFTPGLKVIDYTGLERAAVRGSIGRGDLVLTTYATMRMDIEVLREIEFGCVVLDEAQTIKNATSQAAKAARLLKATRRLALTGTPVENRLEDLWSIFEFLNPGMLGSMPAFQQAAKSDKDADGMVMLRRALRPFLLRRTKATVAPELPARSEQTVRCELEGKQRKLYDDLRTHYQTQLLGRVEREGMNKSKMHVLEALLRLRQVACHPALIEPKALPRAKGASPAGASRVDKPVHVESAKVSMLVEMLEELGVEGHKALVFSQFTSMLALVKAELDQKGITYEELDGTTSAKERDLRVDRFQSTPVKDGGRGVFLISLKAGGVGLNLTAAGYVFLLDPWWNPAVEAQAIDRAHRIGQDKSVIAYRLIATGTVEERILELQERKKELVSAIISENAGPLSSMTREDLEWLLS